MNCPDYSKLHRALLDAIFLIEDALDWARAHNTPLKPIEMAVARVLALYKAVVEHHKTDSGDLLKALGVLAAHPGVTAEAPNGFNCVPEAVIADLLEAYTNVCAEEAAQK